LIDIKEYVLESFEGELPFNIKRRQNGKTFDFKTNTNDCAYVELTNHDVVTKNIQDMQDTQDIQDLERKSKRFFLGDSITLESLQISNLREFDDWQDSTNDGI